MIFFFSRKEGEPFMKGVYSDGTRPEEKAKSDNAEDKKALVSTLPSMPGPERQYA